MFSTIHSLLIGDAHFRHYVTPLFQLPSYQFSYEYFIFYDTYFIPVIRWFSV
jgi:hypothetical protein